MFKQEAEAKVTRLPLRQILTCEIHENKDIFGCLKSTKKCESWYSCGMFTDRCECHFIPLMTRFAHRIKMYRSEWLVAIALPESAKNEPNNFPEITTKKATTANTEVNMLTDKIQTKRW